MNVFFGILIQRINVVINCEKILILSRFEEIKLETADQMFPFKWNPHSGHYTAMVWSRSFKIGCGFVKIPNERYKTRVRYLLYKIDLFTSKCFITFDYVNI